MIDANISGHVIVGQIGSTYGIKGWLKVLSYTDKITNILDYHPWYIESSTAFQPLKVEDSSQHGKGIIVKVEGYSNPEESRLLSGKKIFILKSQLPALPSNEYYWSDLQGLTVIDQHGATLGKVLYLIETGSNDVMVIKGLKEHAIPYLPGDVVMQIDLRKGELHVNWEVI